MGTIIQNNGMERGSPPKQGRARLRTGQKDVTRGRNSPKGLRDTELSPASEPMSLTFRAPRWHVL